MKPFALLVHAPISDPVCKYSVSIFVKYNLIYFDVSAKNSVQILTQILANRYSIHPCIYWILTCKYQILTSKYHILKSSIWYSRVNISMYLHVFGRYFGFEYMHIRTCIERLLHVTVRLRAGARCLHGRRAVAAESSSRRCRRIINKFIWIRSAWLDSGSQRQLEQQQLCCALKCLGAVGCQWSSDRLATEKRYRWAK